MKRSITVDDLSRPGLEMAGYFRLLPEGTGADSGKTEITFHGDALPSEERIDRIERLCDDETPCFIITRGLDAPPELIEQSNAKQIPVLRSNVATTIFLSRITNFLGTQACTFCNDSWRTR